MHVTNTFNPKDYGCWACFFEFDTPQDTQTPSAIAQLESLIIISALSTCHCNSKTTKTFFQESLGLMYLRRRFPPLPAVASLTEHLPLCFLAALWVTCPFSSWTQIMRNKTDWWITFLIETLLIMQEMSAVEGCVGSWIRCVVNILINVQPPKRFRNATLTLLTPKKVDHLYSTWS